MKNAVLILFLFLAYNGFAQITCPNDITINCDQDYTDTLVIGSPFILDSMNIDDISISFTLELNVCNVGTVLVAYSLDNNVICTQTVTMVNPFGPLDPNTILPPQDTSYTFCGYLPFEEPTWSNASCNLIEYTEVIDTTIFTEEWDFTLTRTLTIIDWCVYEETDGLEGLYTFSHLITILDEKPPSPFCLSFYSLLPSELPFELKAEMFNLTAGDNCTHYTDLRFTFSDIPPEDDPSFVDSLNSSVLTISSEYFNDGTVYQEVYHWDLAGNNDYCTVIISLKPEILPVECTDPTYALVDSRNSWKTGIASRLRFNPDSVLIDTRYFNQLEIGLVSNGNWSGSNLYMSECDGRLYGRKNSETSLYFDFNLEVGDTLFSEDYIGSVDLRIEAINDVTYYDGSIRKTMTVEALNGFGNFEMIEGIGSTIFALNEFENVGQIGFDQSVRCFTVDDEIVYTDFSLFGCYFAENETCPYDITLTCDQDYTDLSLTGEVLLNGNSELDSISIITYAPNLDACGVGTVAVTHMADDSIICIQTITIENTYPQFDPVTLVLPSDIILTDCAFGTFETPSWTSSPCDFIGYSEIIDTTSFSSNWNYTLSRVIVIIDWCLYDQTDGEEGLYSSSQKITVIDETPPVIDCLYSRSFYPSELPIDLKASMFNLGTYDNCTDSSDMRFTYAFIFPEQDPEFVDSINSSIKIISLDDFENGTLGLEIYHWDLAGYSNSCDVVLFLKDECLEPTYPMVNPRNQWNILDFEFDGTFSTTKQRFKNDSILIEEEYYYQLEMSENEFGEDWVDYPLYMRECNGKIYSREDGGEEKLYFDFNLEIGDTLLRTQYVGNIDLRVNDISEVTLLDGSIRKKIGLIMLDDIGYFTMIEGIGNNQFPLAHFKNITLADYLITVCSFTVDNELVIMSQELSSCWPVGINDQLSDDVIDIYPNPGSLILNIITTKDANISISTINGNQIYSKNILSGPHEVNASNWMTGVYFITIATQEGRLTKRWIKI